jgi:hypothetical protein
LIGTQRQNMRRANAHQHIQSRTERKASGGLRSLAIAAGPGQFGAIQASASSLGVEVRRGHCGAALMRVDQRVHQRGERESNLIRIKEVSASRGKAMRAEPVSLLYEKQRVLHRRGLDQLEAEMMALSRDWDRSVDGSPNRLDAMIWGITRLSKIITQIPIA